MIKKPFAFFSGVLVAAALWSVAAFGASPQLSRIMPRGGQRGTEVDLSITGTRLGDVQEVIFYEPGIEVVKLEASKPELLKVHVKIAADCSLGEHKIRLRAVSGISELKSFWVGPFPTTQNTLVANKTPNLTMDTARPLELNTTMEGVVQAEQVHYYRINAKKGDRISAEVEGIRLGTIMFDPFLTVIDPAKFELASSDDTALLRQDPFVSFIAPKDGPFFLQVRESSFGGSADSNYRLHYGNYPRPLVVFPMGGKAGETIKAAYLGDPRGPIMADIKLPDQPVGEYKVFVNQDGQSPPSPNYLRVSDFPNVMKDGDCSEISKPQDTQLEIPFAINGIIEKPKLQDHFKFKAKKGESVEVSVYARRLRSPLDSMITIWNVKGQYLANNDDSGSPDSYLRFTPPEDGEYIVGIRDQLRGGGQEYAYRIELTHPQPSVTISIPNAGQVNGPTQERQTIPVPIGNRYATLMRSVRSGVNGELTLSADSLPPGVTMIAEPFRTQSDVTPVIFEAAADAKIGGNLVGFSTKSLDGKETFTSKLNQRIELVIGQPNNTPYSHTEADKLVVAVTQEAPYMLELDQPKVPLVASGSMKLKIRAVRKPDFKEVIKVKFLFPPPGINAQPVDMPGDKSEIEMPISCNDGTAPRNWKIAVIAEANVGGPLWVSSRFVDLTIAPPYITGKIQMAAVEQGVAGQLVCELTQANKFDGMARLELLGLPSNVTAEPCEIGADATKVVFNVTATDKAAKNQTTGLYVQATLKKEGEDIVYAVAKNGVLRVDPAKVAPSTKPVQVAATQPTTKPKPIDQPKVLTRLEKLRQEQEESKSVSTPK